DQINLERAMKLSDRLGGHLVLGHVDGVGKIISIASRTTSWWVTIEVTQSLIKYAIPVGSVAVDGISLTVAELHDSRISVSIIPHTWEKTIIGTKKAGDSVNLEMDMIGKYVERLFGEKEKKSIITEEWLKSKGF
ncbi:riboflavin synthase, partial [bacterium]|nr:riboflavin synthase [bacterium]